MFEKYEVTFVVVDDLDELIKSKFPRLKVDLQYEMAGMPQLYKTDLTDILSVDEDTSVVELIDILYTMGYFDTPFIYVIGL